MCPRPAPPSARARPGKLSSSHPTRARPAAEITKGGGERASERVGELAAPLRAETFSPECMLASLEETGLRRRRRRRRLGFYRPPLLSLARDGARYRGNGCDPSHESVSPGGGPRLERPLRGVFRRTERPTAFFVISSAESRPQYPLPTGTYQGQWLRGMRHGYGVRTSAPFGLASHRAHEDEHGDGAHAAAAGSATGATGGPASGPAASLAVPTVGAKASAALSALASPSKPDLSLAAISNAAGGAANSAASAVSGVRRKLGAITRGSQSSLSEDGAGGRRRTAEARGGFVLKTSSEDVPRQRRRSLVERSGMKTFVQVRLVVINDSHAKCHLFCLSRARRVSS